MKSRWLSFVMISLFLFSFASCSENTSNGANEESNGYDIKIKTPIVMSQNNVKLSDGSTVYVNIEMICGRYCFDEMAGAFQGANWSGQYQIRVYTNEFDFDSTKYLAQISLNENQEMIFKDSFSLLFDDYNNDGNPDFVLGQYGSSNGFEYTIFSIYQNGEVNRLDTDNGSMFIGMHDYSILLEKLSPSSFKIEFYDNSIGGFIERIYQWEVNKFIAKAE